MRKWLCLPHDTHTAIFYVKARDGGLEVPRLRYLISPMKARRMAKMEESDDPVMQVVATSPTSLGARRKCAQLANVAGRELSNSADVREFLSSQLHASVYCRQLRQHEQAPQVNRWITDGSVLLSGWDYIQYVTG